MAKISETLYNSIAQAYSAIQVSLSTVEDSAKAALTAIVNVDTLDYPEAGSNADPDAAIEIELALLQTFNNSYVASGAIASSTSSLLDAVQAVNDFVIKNSTESGTSTEKLQAWINTEMSGSWSDTFCPVGWKEICSDAGYVTTGWTTE